MTRHDPFATAGRRRPGQTARHAYDFEKEVNDMFIHTGAIRAIHEERIGRYMAEARAERIAADLRATRAGHERVADRRVRRAIGRSIVRFGQRLAAEPDALRPAGSR